MTASRKTTALLDELGLVTREAWAAVRGGSLRTLRRDETLRRGPIPVRIGRTCYYKKSEIAAWIEAQREAQQKPATRKRARTGRFAARRGAST